MSTREIDVRQRYRSASKRGSAYVHIPRHVLTDPPIRHRHMSDQYLTPYEFAVGAGALVSAQAVLANSRHQEALKSGEEAIERQDHYHTKFKREWQKVSEQRRRGIDAPAPMYSFTFRDEVRHKTGMSKRKVLQEAGKHGYRKQLKRSRRMTPPEIITIEVSQRALLRQAGLQSDGAHHRRLADTLNRLCLPIGDAQPMLKGWERTPSRRLRLQVFGAWLAPPFGRVPLPLPVCSPTALALYLFLHGIKTNQHLSNPSNIRQHDLKSFYRRIGIATRWGEAVCKRTFKRAFDAVNTHLDLFDINVLRKHRIPERYGMETSRGGRKVLFVAVPRKRSARGITVVPKPDELVREDCLIGFDDLLSKRASTPRKMPLMPEQREFKQRVRELLE
jgi:hypothetical protein